MKKQPALKKNEVQAAFYIFCHFRIGTPLSKHILLAIWLCGIFVIVQ